MIDALAPLRCLSRAAPHGAAAPRAIRWRTAWAGTEGEGIAIGLLDAPFDEGHPDLAGADVARKDFATAAPAASHSHGTCSVTTLLGQGRRLVRGIVPRASLRVASVVGPGGIASDLAVARAIEWLTAEGVRLVMIPLGGARANRTVRAAIRRAADAGTICFAAYGNAVSARGLFPAREPAAISVAGADDCGALGFALPAAHPPDLIAPGWNIPVALGRTHSARVSGSSLATVLAGGLAARAVAAAAAAAAPASGKLCREALLALLLAHHHERKEDEMSKEPAHDAAAAKPEFGPAGLRQVVTKMKTSYPELLTRDWRQFVRESFRLHADQERSLMDAAPAKVREIQHFFSEAAGHMRQGGKLAARIIKLPVAKQTAAAVHELHIDVETAAMSPQLSIVIAHCDANCRNWGWGPG